MNAETQPHRDSSDGRAPVHRGLLHDLAHGLFALSCLAESPISGEQVPAAARERLALIAGETARLLELVRRVLSEGDGPRPLDVRVLLEAVAAVSRHTADATVTVLPGEPVWLTVDEVSLWRMTTNLVDNAVRAAGPDGVVELSAAVGPPVVVTVADDGPGFGQGPKGWTSQGLRVVAEQARAGGVLVRISPRSPHGTCARMVFAGPPARSRRKGAGDGHTRHR
jgi:signal transduction histidine kinase